MLNLESSYISNKSKLIIQNDDFKAYKKRKLIMRNIIEGIDCIRMNNYMKLDEKEKKIEISLSQ